jgi:predicted SAM-dependent methyltransferase
MSQYIIQFRPGKVLEIGGGNNPLCDANSNRITINMDIREGKNIDITHSLEDIPWPFEDKSFEGIFAKYVIEHISWHDVATVLKEMYRVLKEGGKLVAFVPNTPEQCKRIISEGVNQGTVELLFGSQEFTPRHIGSHKMGFSRDYAKELFKKAGFNFVKIVNHPVSSTDLIVEAHKINPNDVYERFYFDGMIGYGGDGYRDFATHITTCRLLEAIEPKITSLLDVGGGRGYITRILESKGIKSTCMEISNHCYHTRATDNFVLHDARNIPWPFKDKEFDASFSMNFLEHIEKEKLDDILKEMVRVSNRGVHGIHFTDSPFEELDEDIDITHHTVKSRAWWNEKIKSVIPDYEIAIQHPRLLEYDQPEKQPPVSLMPFPPDSLIKLNLGSFRDMFYDGWVNIDILDLNDWATKSQAYAFKQHDVTKGLPYDDNSVDIIMSNHMLEHLTRQEGDNLMRECYRVLKPDGIIRINTPDGRQLTQEYLDGKIMQYRYINVGVENAKDDAEAYHELLMAGHKTIYDETSLTKLFERAGFKNIKRCSPFESKSDVIKKQTITTHPSISIILEGEA